MASSTPPLQVAFRTIIMAGSLVVGSMAAYLYGPPAEDLAHTIDSLASRVWEIQESVAGHNMPDMMDTPMAGTQAPTFMEPAMEPAPLTIHDADPLTAPPIVDQAVTPASAELTVENPSNERLLAPILAAGASDAAIEPWGSTGEVYRAWAVVPADGLRRHLNALAESPADAAAQLLAQIDQMGAVR